MEFFIDTGNIEEIKEANSWGLIDGVTTNPTLIMRSHKDPDTVYQAIKDIGVQDISMEVVGNGEQMLLEGLRLNKEFGSVATIKVPCTEEGLYACRTLSHMEVKTNVTLVFSAAQAILAAKAGATYLSPFVGRVDDQSFDGIKLIEEIAEIYSKHMVRTHILAASVRTVRQVTDSFLAGADLATLPPAVMDKMYKHMLTDNGLAQFEKDWASVPKNV